MAPLSVKRADPPADFHPFIYKIAIGLVVLFVVAAWATFDRRGETGENLVMVTLLLFVAVMIPLLLWLTWKHHRAPQATLQTWSSFRDWAHGSTEVWQSRVSGKDAAIDALLPIAAVVIGILLYGVALDIVRYVAG
jgi:hypothetical protein